MSERTSERSFEERFDHSNPGRTSLSVLVIALVVAVVTAGCGRSHVAELSDGVLTLGEFQEAKTERRAMVLGDRRLTIEGENGSLSLAGGQPGQVALTFNVQARGDSRDDAREQLDDLMIEEVGDETSYTFDIRPDRSDLTNVDVTGTVPSDAEVRLILRGGNVTLSNLNGVVNVLLENGSISYLGGSGSLTLSTRNGNVAADFYDLGVGDVAALSTTNGSVTLGVTDRSNANVNASTSSGDVRVNGFEFGDPRLARRGASARFSAEIGAGGAAVNMKTQNGDLIFRRHSLVPPSTVAAPIDTTAADTTAADTVDSNTIDADAASPESTDTVDTDSMDTAPPNVDTDTMNTTPTDNGDESVDADSATMPAAATSTPPDVAG